MDFVRVQGEERLYDREAVLGRDASSVFPSEIKKLGKMDKDAAAAVLGSMQFVTESQLLELREAQGGAAAAESEAPLKPLTQVLAEAKEAKEAAFQAGWKQMKTGKNRPLDEDELDFVNAVERSKAAAERAWQDEQDREMDAFREAAKQRAEAAAARQPGGPPVGPAPKPSPEPAKPSPKPGEKRLALQHVVRRKPAGTGAGTSAQPLEQPQKRHKADGGSAAGPAGEEAAGRRAETGGAEQGTVRATDAGAGPEAEPAQRHAATQAVDDGGAQLHSGEQRESVNDTDGGSAGLTALVGDYGSDSEG